MASSIVTEPRKLPSIPTETSQRVSSDFTPSRVPDGNNTDFKKNTYLYATQYGDRLNEDKDLDKILKQYLRGHILWANIAKLIATEESKRKEKGPRIRKGPLMQN